MTFERPVLSKYVSLTALEEDGQLLVGVYVSVVMFPTLLLV